MLRSNQGFWMELEENLLTVDLTKKLKFQANFPEIHAIHSETFWL